MKICATVLGETVGDVLSISLSIGYIVSSLILSSTVATSLVLQLVSKRGHPVFFWAVVFSTSTAATMLTDLFNSTFGLSYLMSALIVVVLLAAIFGYWRYTAGSVSLSNIKSSKVELLFCGALLFTNTLGDGMSDFLTEKSGLHFSGRAILLVSLLAILALCYYFTKASRVLLFWAAFILTRPFGSMLSDLLTKPADDGWLDLGLGTSSAIFAAILYAFVVYATFANKQEPNAPAALQPQT